MAKKQFGGSFAPPLSDEKLKFYAMLVNDLPVSALKDALVLLLKCCTEWWELPEPGEKTKKPHLSGAGVIVDLDEAHAKHLWEHIPWDHELDAIEKLCNVISAETHRDLRNCAFHLLWHVKELNLDREPITNDLL